MSARALIAELGQRGVDVIVLGDKVRFRPRHLVTPNLIDQLRQHKAEVVALLANKPEAPAAAPDPVSKPSDTPHADAAIAKFEATAVPYPDGSGWQRPGFDRSALDAGVTWAELKPQLIAALRWNLAVYGADPHDLPYLNTRKALRELGEDPGPAPQRQRKPVRRRGHKENEHGSTLP